MKQKNEKIDVAESEARETIEWIGERGGLPKMFDELFEQNFGFRLKEDSIISICALLTSRSLFSAIYSDDSAKLKKIADFLYDFAPNATMLASREFDNSMLIDDNRLVIIEDSQDLSEEAIEIIAQNIIDRPREEVKLSVVMMIKTDKFDKRLLSKGVFPIRV